MAQSVVPSAVVSARDVGFGRTPRSRRGFSLLKGVVFLLVMVGAGYLAYRLLASKGGAPSDGGGMPVAAVTPSRGAPQAPAAPASPSAAPSSLQKPAAAPSPTAPAVPPSRQTPGRALYGQGQWSQAATKLVEEASAAQPPDAAELLTLAADCHARLNEAAEAEKLWSRVAKDYSAQPAAAKAAARLGDVLAARGDKLIARNQYAIAYRHPQAAPADRDLFAQKMIELNQELLFSRKQTPDAVEHVVQPGENLTVIGKKYHVEPLALLRINGLKNANLYPSDKLKIPKGTFRVDVSKSRRRLTLLYNDTVARQYDVAIGREGFDTPVGEFVVAAKETSPTWTMTTEDGRRVVVAYGQPGHMLGTRWIGFEQPHRDIGIHGTPKEEESKIGGAVSKGCVRMRNTDVEELYDLIPRGTKVTIRE